MAVMGSDSDLDVPRRLLVENSKPIADAPRDGTEIIAWDGQWWRDLVRWRVAAGGWFYMRLTPLRPTHWYPVGAERTLPELKQAVDAGYMRG
jgi:hypothetical protein